VVFIHVNLLPVFEGELSGFRKVNSLVGSREESTLGLLLVQVVDHRLNNGRNFTQLASDK
jgi:hypothetical protein